MIKDGSLYILIADFSLMKAISHKTIESSMGSPQGYSGIIINEYQFYFIYNQVSFDNQLGGQFPSSAGLKADFSLIMSGDRNEGCYPFTTELPTSYNMVSAF